MPQNTDVTLADFMSKSQVYRSQHPAAATPETFPPSPPTPHYIQMDYRKTR